MAVVSALTTTVAILLCGVLVLRPESPTRTHFVQVPEFGPAKETREPGDESVVPNEPPMSAWRLRQHQVRSTSESLVDILDDEPVNPQRLLRAGDVMRNMALWSSFTN